MWKNSDILNRRVSFIVTDKDVPNAYGTTKAIFFDAEPYQGKPTKNFAYVGFPDIEKPKDSYPAVVLAHGGGSAACHEWVEYWNSLGYVAIAPDFYGNEFTERMEKRIPNRYSHYFPYMGSFANTKEDYKDSVTYHAVSNIILCHNILRDSGFVNKDKVALTGISWGSVYTCIASGVDQRFCCFVPVYGGGYISKTIPFRNESNNYIKPANEKEWVELFDPISYLPYNKKPMMFTSGALDGNFSVLFNQKSSELSKGKVYYAEKDELFHDMRWRADDEMQHVVSFINYVVKGIKMPFMVINDSIKDNVITVKVDNYENVKIAKLVYTLSSLEETDSSKWKWETQIIEKSDKGYSVKVPENTTVCFVELSDLEKNEFIESSKIYVLKDVNIDDYH